MFYSKFDTDFVPIPWAIAAPKMNFSIKVFFSNCDQIRRKTANVVTFTEEILNEKMFCAVCKQYMA